MTMCFSASASFIAGGVLSTAGVATLKKTTKKSEVPYASVPLLFGIQQTIEGFLWLSFQYNWLLVQSVTTLLFSFFAYSLWPFFMPFAVRLLEPDLFRKKILSYLLVIGTAVSLYLLYFIVRYPVTAEILRHNIAYTETIPFAHNMFWFYAMAGVGSCLVSSHRYINIFGLLVTASIAITYWFYAFAFVSVWCFFAAGLSVVVYLFFVNKNHNPKSQLAKVSSKV